MRFLKRYTFLSLFVLFVGALCLVATLYLNRLYETILEENITKNSENIETKFTVIKTYLLNTKKDLFFIAKLYKEIEDIDVLSKTLKLFNSENLIYSQIRYINYTGKEILRINNRSNQLIITPKEQLQHKENRYYFKESLKLNENEVYLSLFDLNMENKKIEIPYKPTLRFSTPILSHNKKIDGFVILNYSGEKLLNFLKQNKRFNTLLINKNSDYLLSTKMPTKEWNFMLKQNDGLKFDNPVLWEKIKSTKLKRFVFENDDTYYSVVKINPIEIMSPNRVEKSRREWFLISYFNKQKVLDEFVLNINSLLIPFIFILTILTLASYLLSHYLKRLEKANERIEIASNAFENSQEGILVLNKDGQIVNINKGFTSITGYTYDEVYLKNPRLLKDLTHTVSENFFEIMWSTIQEKDFWSGELYNKRKNGQNFIEHLTISTIKERGKIKYYVGVFSDITQRVKQKEKIEKTNKELVQTLTHLKVAQDQLIESEKLAALGQLIAGIAHEINSPLGAIKTSSSNVLDALNRTLVNKPTLEKILDSHEKELVKELQEEISSSTRYLSIKEQRELKKEIRKKLNDADIDDARYLADLLSSFMIEDLEKYFLLLKHENAKFILNTVHDEFITTSNLHNIQNSVQRASKTIFALKKFAHFDHEREGTYQKLEHEIENVLILLNHNLKHNIDIIKHYESLEPVFCYPDELSQVWMNLISNAVHAMDNKGTITLSITEDETYQIVSIHDTGCGIPDEIKEKIFQPFFTTKEAGVGSGLGLDIVSKVIEAHDGKIELQSNKKGTTFYVKIPKRSQE